MQKMRFENYFNFASFGVNVRIESNDRNMLSKARSVINKALIGKLNELSETEEPEFSFGIELADNLLLLYKDGEYLTSIDNERVFLKYLDSMVRSRITEHAKGLVFVHAGVVGWREKAIIIPARSGMGKTTLVAELIKEGATYYSDEYAIFDEKGLNHPFARPLSMRMKEGEKIIVKDVMPDEFGASVGREPISVGMVVLTKYEPNEHEKIEPISVGNGILEVINHTIPFSYSPENSLKVLKTALSRAIILKGKRSDAKQFAQTVLSLFDFYIDSGTVDSREESFFGGDNEQSTIPNCS